MSFKNSFRNFIAITSGKLFPLKKLSSDDIQKDMAAGKIKKVLFIRHNQGIGDMILATPIFRAMREALPSAEIDLLASSHNEVAVRNNKRLNRVYVWDKKEMNLPWKLARFISKISHQNYDLIILISSHTPSFTAFLYARLIGSKYVLAYDTSSSYDGAKWSKWMANIEIPLPPDDIHESKKFSALLSPLGIKCSLEPEFEISNDDKIWAKNAVKQFNHRPLAGIFLGGNPKRYDRLWSAKNWATLTKILESHNISVIAIVPPEGLRGGGGVYEKGIYDYVCEAAGKKLTAFSELSLDRLVAFLCQLDTFICPDGGLFHTAAAAGANTVGLFFKTPAWRWSPKVSWVKPIQSPTGTPEGITPQDVFEAVMKILSEKNINPEN